MSGGAAIRNRHRHQPLHALVHRAIASSTCRMECEKLIETVRKYPVLYDLCHEDYKNLKKKNKIWDEIGKEMEKTGEDLKKQWKNLRDCYSKHLRSLKTHTGQAASNTIAYKTWPWAKNMDFLRPFLKFSKSATNVRSNDNGSIDKLTQCNYLSQTENLAASTSLGTPLNPTTPIPEKTMEESESVDSDVEVVIPRKKKKVVKETTLGVDKVISFLKEKKSDTESMDATELIFLGYAKTIKTFSAKRQAVTKMKISELVMKQNLLQIEENEEKSSLGKRNFENCSNTTPSASAASWYEDFGAIMDEFNNGN